MQPENPNESENIRSLTSSIISHAILFGLLGLSLWLFLNPQAVRQLIDGKPCQKPIYYTIGQFDDDFGISKEDFKDTVEKSIAVWEKAADLNLFEYKETDLATPQTWWQKIKARFSNRIVAVNLIYDERQKATEASNDLKGDISQKKAASEEVRKSFEALKQRYEHARDAYNANIDAYEDKLDAYNNEVEEANKKGGATAEEYRKLNDEKNELTAEKASLEKQRQNVNSMASEINSLVQKYNNLTRETNMYIKEYNSGEFVGREFEEGTYTTDINGERIDIFQFSTKTKLFRVLTHEFGHALGLDHNENAKSIMYRANQGTNLALTAEDMADLKKVCSL
jgi:hypothetical protein